jgi:hypothetical protein
MYEAKAANKNCVRFAADLASRDPVKRIAANPETTDYTDLHI